MCDSLVIYYTSMVRQKPKSQLAISWCIENGYEKHAEKYAHPKTYAAIIQERKKKKEKKKVKEMKKAMKSLNVNG